MRFNLFGSIYDDGNDSKAKAFFEKMRKWLDNLTSPEAIKQLKGIFLKDSFARTCLVEGSNANGAFEDGMLLESSGFSKALFGKSSLDSQIDEAFNQPSEKPESKEKPSFDLIYQITKDGKMEQTEASKFDEKVYWQDVRKQEKETIEESTNLSLDQKFKEAFD